MGLLFAGAYLLNSGYFSGNSSGWLTGGASQNPTQGDQSTDDGDQGQQGGPSPGSSNPGDPNPGDPNPGDPSDPGGGDEAPGGGCFVAGTLVATESGFVPIEEVRPGRRVFGCSFDDPRRKSMRSVQSVVGSFRGDVVNLSFRRGELRCTAHQAFLCGGRWVRAAELKAGSLVTNVDGSEDEVLSWSREPERVAVYHLVVADRHTYIVQESRHHAAARDDPDPDPGDTPASRRRNDGTRRLLATTRDFQLFGQRIRV